MTLAQRSVVIKLYKTLLFMGRDYPLGYHFFRERCHKVFLKNSAETEPEKIEQMIRHAEFVIKELEAMYMMKKYRTLKSRYCDKENSETLDDLMKRINERGN